MTARTLDHQRYKTLPRTPSSASQDSNNLDVARRAANLSFSASPSVTNQPSSGKKTPNAALLAAQITGTKTPSPNRELKTHERLSRTFSNDSQSAASTSNGSLAAAQAIAKRYGTVGARPSTEDLIDKRLSHNLSPTKRSPAYNSNDPLIAAQLSASREKSFESTSSISSYNNTASTVAAHLAASRSSMFNMDRNRDQAEDILPSLGSVQNAKRKLFQNDSNSTKNDSKTISAHNTGQSDGAYQAVTSAAIRKSFESQRVNGMSKLGSLESPTPVRTIGTLSTGESLTAALNAVRKSPSTRQETSSLSSQAQQSKSLKLYDPSSMVEIDQSKPFVNRPQLKDRLHIKSFDGKINPPEVLLQESISASSTGNNALNAASTAMRETLKDRSPPAPPPPRRSRISQETFKTPQDKNEQSDSYFPDSELKLSITSSRKLRTEQTFHKNPSTATLPILPSRGNESTTSISVLTRNFTGPDLSSTTAAALAFSSPLNKSNWRDDLPYLSHTGRSLHPSYTGESSRHAVVASSLASSRAPSPAKVQPVSPPPLRPNQGLRTTLRKPDKKEEREQSPPKAKKHLVKHPHKHHEGTRRRWREVITEKERRRYEGLWAANRGLYLPDDITPDGSMRDGVCSVVVRDLWNRSRLPSEILENVWDLVDRSYKGWLTREEFIMGLWLIDQSLKGRKLPGRVQPGTWESIHRLGVVLKDHRQLGLKPEKHKKRGKYGF